MADDVLVFAPELGEGAQVLFFHLAPDALAVGGVDEGHAASLETGAGEAAAVDAVGMGHDVVEGLQFGRAGLVVVDARMAALKAQAAEGVEVAAAPGFGTLFHARELGVPVFGTACPVLGQAVAVLAEHLDGDLAQVGIAKLAVLHAGEGLEGVGGAAALVDAHVELAAGEGALHTAEEDGDGIGLHRGMGGDELIVVVEGIEVEQMVLAREELAALVELT